MACFTTLLLFSLHALQCLSSSLPRLVRAAPEDRHGQWITSWTAMPQLTELANLPTPPYNQTSLVFHDATIRQTIRLTQPSTTYLRLRLSNAFGAVELPITKASIALPEVLPGSGQNLTGSSAINPATMQPLTFSGNSSITIPNGAEVISDPIALTLPAGSILTINLYLQDGQATQLITSHPGSRTSSWLAQGDYTSSRNLTSTATSIAHWYFISSLEAWNPNPTPSSGTFIIVGDSITDGRESWVNGNGRWPDVLFNRLQTLKSPTYHDLAVANQAAGGNRVLYDGLGPNALSRIDRDVLSRPSAKYVLIFEGVNDIGTAAVIVANQTQTGDRLIQAYQQIITKCHAFGLPVLGATITPFGSRNVTLQPYSDPERENTRQRVNAWIRGQGNFDGVVDFDAVVRNPLNQSMLAPEYDSGDQLHPNQDGYNAMANAFPVELLEKFKHGVGRF